MGLLDFKLNSSPRPELFSSPGLLLAYSWSAPTPKCHWSAPLVPNPREPSPRVSQPQSLPGVPNPRVSLECPTPEAQPQSFPSPKCPAPESPWSAQPQSLPRVPNPRLSPKCPVPECCCSAQPQSISTKRGWGCSKYFIIYIYIYIYFYFILFFFLGGGGPSGLVAFEFKERGFGDEVLLLGFRV